LQSVKKLLTKRVNISCGANQNWFSGSWSNGQRNLSRLGKYSLVINQPISWPWIHCTAVLLCLCQPEV